LASAVSADADVAVTAAEIKSLLPPVDRQEIWAACVTYRRSRDARKDESTTADVYDRVYDADRPELS
jgi:2-dehydro-3-deoxy-D-arabinonate dehydratase